MFLKGLNPEIRMPAEAVMQDADNVHFVAVWKRPTVTDREEMNLAIMQTQRESSELIAQLQDGSLDAIGYTQSIRTNNQRLGDLVGKHLSRCEGLVDGAGQPVEWSNEVHQQMMSSNEYSIALVRSMRELAIGKKVELVDGKNSNRLATAITAATNSNVVPMPMAPVAHQIPA